MTLIYFSVIEKRVFADWVKALCVRRIANGTPEPFCWKISEVIHMGYLQIAVGQQRPFTD